MTPVVQPTAGRVGPVLIDGIAVFGFRVAAAWGLRLRLDACDLAEGQRVRVAVPPDPLARPYYVHEVAWVDGQGWWVALVEVMDVGPAAAGDPF